jgi:hypothetical protein
MPTPLPEPDQTDLDRPGAAEVAFLSRGVLSAIEPAGGHTQLQAVLMEATFEAMTGFPADLGAPPISPAEFGSGMARRNEAFRTRILQIMLLGALVLRPLPEDVAERVTAFAAEMAVDDGMLQVARRYAEGSLGLAAYDFQRNGYTADWSSERQGALHATHALAEAWDVSVNDPELAGRWAALESLAPGSLGRAVADFYAARGFVYPGRVGSAPPLLAQHDWVHVLADYGTTVESELEVFAFIARANDDPRGFSLLAMVISLFETGYLRTGAGLFEAFPGRLSRTGVATRVADAMLRGALVHGSVDFLAVDWFALADQPVDDVRRQFGVTPKSAKAVSAGAVGPWERGGISEYQWKTGSRLADEAGRPYDAFGASVTPPEPPP